MPWHRAQFFKRLALQNFAEHHRWFVAIRVRKERDKRKFLHCHFHKNNKNTWKCSWLYEPILSHSFKFCLCGGITAIYRMSQNSLRLASLPSKNKKNASTSEHIHIPYRLVQNQPTLLMNWNVVA